MTKLTHFTYLARVYRPKPAPVFYVDGYFKAPENTARAELCKLAYVATKEKHCKVIGDLDFLVVRINKIVKKEAN